jgi:hypothetical protein
MQRPVRGGKRLANLLPKSHLSPECGSSLKYGSHFTHTIPRFHPLLKCEAPSGLGNVLRHLSRFSPFAEIRCPFGVGYLLTNTFPRFHLLPECATRSGLWTVLRIHFLWVDRSAKCIVRLGRRVAPRGQCIPAQSNALGGWTASYPRSEGTLHSGGWRACDQSTPIQRSFRTRTFYDSEPRAMPWAGMQRPVERIRWRETLRGWVEVWGNWNTPDPSVCALMALDRLGVASDDTGLMYPKKHHPIFL